MSTHELAQATEDAKGLLAIYRDIIGDDDEARADFVEGQTDLLELIKVAADQLFADAALVDGIDEAVDRLKERAHRIKERMERVRTLITAAMETSAVKKIETPVATLTLKAVPPSIRVTDESAIPAVYWRQSDPTLDRRALLAALKDGEAVAGAELSNGGVTLQMRVQ